MYMQIYIYVHIYKINIHIPLKNTTGCSSLLKIVFFPMHCNPSPASRRTTHPRKRSECTVTLIG